MTDVLITTYYAITDIDGKPLDRVKGNPIENSDGTHQHYRSEEPAYKKGWMVQDPTFDIKFATHRYEVVKDSKIISKFHEKFVLIDLKNKQEFSFIALYETKGDKNISSDGVQRFELIASPDNTISHAVIDFTTQPSGRKVRTVSVYGKNKEAKPACSNNISAGLVRALVGN
jgi:hypothetical protein